MQNNINLSAEAMQAIAALRHKNGTFNYYRNTLNRLHTYILHQSDEIGMSDTETLHTLRVLDSISSDLAALAGPAATGMTPPDTPEEVAERVESVFTDEVNDSNCPEKLDEPREMLHDVNVAFRRLNQLQEIISEAITHAQNAGEKYDSIISDLKDVKDDLEPVVAVLDAIMAIEPDSYEPKEQTPAEKASTLLWRAEAALCYSEKAFIEAVDYAKRAEAGDAFSARALELGRVLEDSIEKIRELHGYAPVSENPIEDNMALFGYVPILEDSGDEAQTTDTDGSDCMQSEPTA